MWPTAKSSPSGPDYARAAREGAGGDDLATVVAKRMLPTMTATDAHGHGYTRDKGKKGKERPTLVGVARMYPTVTAQDTKNDGGPSQWVRNTPPLNTLVKMLATPSAADVVGSHGGGQGRSLRTDIHEFKAASQATGQLSPDWVEPLMGYPVGWTDLSVETIASGEDMRERWLDGTWEDGIPRVATGVKDRVNRLKGLGNAVVPDIPEIIGRAIMEIEA